MLVDQQHGGSPGLITKRASVKNAVKNLSVTNTQQKKPVVTTAVLSSAIEVDVYDFSVEDDHCYYANNILVSNSNYADCFRYMTQAVTKIEAVSNMGGALEKHKQAVAMRATRI